jgi:hypothetical protein
MSGGSCGRCFARRWRRNASGMRLPYERFLKAGGRIGGPCHARPGAAGRLFSNWRPDRGRGARRCGQVRSAPDGHDKCPLSLLTHAPKAADSPPNKKPSTSQFWLRPRAHAPISPAEGGSSSKSLHNARSELTTRRPQGLRWCSLHGCCRRPGLGHRAGCATGTDPRCGLLASAA